MSRFEDWLDRVTDPEQDHSGLLAERKDGVWTGRLTGRRLNPEVPGERNADLRRVVEEDSKRYRF